MIDKITTNNVGYAYPNKRNSVSFGHGDSENNLTGKQKAVILASSAAAMVPTMAVLAKMRGFSLNPAKIAKTPVKDWAIFKYKPKNKAIEFEVPQVISLATSSVIGGFIGGSIIDDKSNLKAKKREVLNQILGNVLVPISCVGLGSKLFNHYAERLQNIMPQINSKKSVVKFLNTCLRNVPNAISTIACLGTGIYLGNKVSNLINEKIYHKKVERDIKATDFAPHLDDVCLATSMMNKESTFGSLLGRFIPIALLFPGYETGSAQEKN